MLKPLSTGSARVFRDQRRVAVGQQAGIGGKLRALAATQQSVQRLTGALAEDVPQRDLDTGERIDERPIAAQQVHRMQDVAGKCVDITRVASYDQRSDDAIQGRLGCRNGGVAKRLAPTDQAVFCLDAHQ